MGNLLAGPIEQLYLTAEMMVILAARPLGFALVFTAFAWAHLNSGLLRIAFGLVLALPAIHPILGEAPAMVKGMPLPAFVMIGKELFIGILLGLLASLPFEALGGAGGIVDSMRGSPRRSAPRWRGHAVRAALHDHRPVALCLAGRVLAGGGCDF